MPFKHVVILLPGISGSVLSRGAHDLWGTGAGAIARAIGSFGNSIRQLQLPSEAQDDDDFDDGITATGLVGDLHLIPGLWKIDGYTKVGNYIVSKLDLRRGDNFIEFPYDWRHDNRRAAKKLENCAHNALRAWREKSGSSDAKLVLVAHSMGGLIARYFIECLEGWKETTALVTFGTPYRGSLNALGFLCNGYSKGIGPLKIDLSSVLQSMDSVYQLLPTFSCLDTGGAELDYVTSIVNVPTFDQARAKRAAEFHQEIKDAREINAANEAYRLSTCQLYPVIGTFQPTWLSAQVRSGAVTLLRTRLGRDEGGDGTVPRGAALPPEQDNMAAGIFTEDIHGSLQNVDNVLEQLRGILTGLGVSGYRAPTESPRPGTMLDDVYTANMFNEITVEPVIVERPRNGREPPQRVRADLVDVVGRIVDTQTKLEVDTVIFRRDIDGVHRGSFNLPPGAYRIRISATDVPEPVTDTFMVIEATD